MDMMNVALQGLQQAAEGAGIAARRLAAAPEQSGGAGDVVDLSAEMVALMQAKNLNGAMVSVAQTAQEMDSHILNLLG